MATDDGCPAILFLCVHNAGRSQMAAGFARALGGNALVVHSAGSEPAEHVNQSAVDAMAELGIEIASATPQRWTTDLLAQVDVIVTMGCGDSCPLYPGKRYLDWTLDDPRGLSVAAVRPIRDEIEVRVRHLLAELGVPVQD